MKKLFNNSSKKILLLLFLLFIYSILCAYSYSEKISSNISNSVFRLHILANSNSKKDQELKYKVRDNIIKYMNSICSNVNSKNQAIQIANNNIKNFEDIAKKTILENGYNYNVKVEIGNFNFPTKKYGDISLPKGNYDALRIKIGESEGKNWWCVMFPPLCFIDVSSGIVPEKSKDLIKNNINEEEYDLITNNSNNEIKFKFKILEIFGNENFNFTIKH